MKRLKELRLNAGKSMAQVSREMNLAYTTYVGYEKGERQPNSEMLIEFAKYYGCTIDYLIGLDEKTVDSITPTSKVVERICLSPLEKKVIISYRSKPEMQAAVNKLLGIDSNSPEIIKIAARDGSFTETTITSDDIENINNLPDVDDI